MILTKIHTRYNRIRLAWRSAPFYLFIHRDQKNGGFECAVRNLSVILKRMKDVVVTEIEDTSIEELIEKGENVSDRCKVHVILQHTEIQLTGSGRSVFRFVDGTLKPMLLSWYLVNAPQRRLIWFYSCSSRNVLRGNSNMPCLADYVASHTNKIYSSLTTSKDRTVLRYFFSVVDLVLADKKSDLKKDIHAAYDHVIKKMGTRRSNKPGDLHSLINLAINKKSLKIEDGTFFSE